jgi:hypothetical protein
MKDNLARQLSVPPSQEVATVVAKVGPRFRLRSQLGEVEARRAASCLIEPMLGDEVLVVHHERGSHVLAVLERDESVPATIATDGDLQLASTGRVTIGAREGVEVVTPKDMAVTAGAVRVRAEQADSEVGALRHLGDSVTLQIERMKTVAKTIETVADRWVSRLTHAYRFIARNDTTRAEYVDVHARAAFHVKAETTVVNSATLAKIDGSQIQLG